MRMPLGQHTLDYGKLGKKFERSMGLGLPVKRAVGPNPFLNKPNVPQRGNAVMKAMPEGKDYGLGGQKPGVISIFEEDVRDDLDDLILPGKAKFDPNYVPKGLQDLLEDKKKQPVVGPNQKGGQEDKEQDPDGLGGINRRKQGPGQAHDLVPVIDKLAGGLPESEEDPDGPNGINRRKMKPGQVDDMAPIQNKQPTTHPTNPLLKPGLYTDGLLRPYGIPINYPFPGGLQPLPKTEQDKINQPKVVTDIEKTQPQGTTNEEPGQNQGDKTLLEPTVTNKTPKKSPVLEKRPSGVEEVDILEEEIQEPAQRQTPTKTPQKNVGEDNLPGKVEVDLEDIEEESPEHGREQNPNDELKLPVPIIENANTQPTIKVKSPIKQPDQTHLPEVKEEEEPAELQSPQSESRSGKNTGQLQELSPNSGTVHTSHADGEDPDTFEDLMGSPEENEDEFQIPKDVIAKLKTLTKSRSTNDLPNAKFVVPEKPFFDDTDIDYGSLDFRVNELEAADLPWDRNFIRKSTKLRPSIRLSSLVLPRLGPSFVRNQNSQNLKKVRRVYLVEVVKCGKCMEDPLIADFAANSL